MSRRLSITVSDDLWDAVSHLDDTQSGVVQKALILLRGEEGRSGGILEGATTDLEKEAKVNPTYQTALMILEGYAEDMYQEGYEHVMDALAANVIFPDWIERTASGYSPSELGGKLADAGDVFATRRHSNNKWIEGRVTSDDLSDFLEKKALPGAWGNSGFDLLRGLCTIIVTAANPSDDLPSGTNSAGYTAFGADGEPRARVAFLLWEGMAAAIFDAFAVMKRVARVTDAPRETDESHQRANNPELEKTLSVLRTLVGNESPALKNWELGVRIHDAEEEQTDRG